MDNRQPRPEVPVPKSTDAIDHQIILLHLLPHDRQYFAVSKVNKLSTLAPQALTLFHSIEIWELFSPRTGIPGNHILRSHSILGQQFLGNYLVPDITPSQDNGLSIAIGFQWPIIHLEKSTLASLIDAQTHRDQVDLDIWFYWFHKLANAMRCEFQLSQACISSDLLYVNSGIILFRDSLILIQHALISLPISWSHNNLLRDRGH